MLPPTPTPHATTILVAEHEHPVCDMVCDVLRTGDWKVIRADDGQQALRMAAALGSEVDLLVTDVVLPGFYGWELAELMKLDWPHLKVLYISPHLDKGILNLCESMFVLLVKPFDCRALLRCVRAVLRTRSLKASPLPQWL